MAAAGMSQRARQAHMRRTDPRLTECTYMDEKLLPIAGELMNLPAVTKKPGPASIPLQAANGQGPDSQEASGNIQESRGSSRQSASSGSTAAPQENRPQRQVADSRKSAFKQGFVAKRQDPAPYGTGSLKKAGDEIRTHDIHVGNVTLYR